MSTPTTTSVHHLVLDLRQHRAWVYWPDVLASALLFWLSLLLLQFVGASQAGWYWPLLCGVLLLASCAVYRAALFVHEIGHFAKRTLPGFELAWNVLLGWPLLFPSFLIQSHPDHHRLASFGTAGDPEYLPLAHATRGQRRWFVASAALVPLLLWVRAAVLVPASWLSDRLRCWLRSHASRMTMNNAYRPAPGALKLSVWHELSEVMTVLCAWVWVAAVWLLPDWWLFAAVVWLCTALTHVLNAWRTLHAHAYTSTGYATHALGQLQDSTTFKLPALLGELLAPVGQRFHAAHHLFPYLPYHALPEAHRRLLASDWAGREVYLKTLR